VGWSGDGRWCELWLRECEPGGRELRRELGRRERELGGRELAAAGGASLGY
jgi:hypothetical protein